MGDVQGAWRKERFRTVYQDSYPAVQRYCRRRLPDAVAEDALSETFTIAWARLDDLPKGDSALPWLYAVARNVIRNQYRKTERSDSLNERLLDDLGRRSIESDGGPPGLNFDERQALADALESLKENDRELIRLTVWEELPHADIAVVLGCSENAVTVRLHRARGRMMKKLTRDRRWSAAGGGTDAAPVATPETKAESVKGPMPLRHIPVDGASDQAKGATR